MTRAHLENWFLGAFVEITIVEYDGLGVHFDKKIEEHPKERGN